MEWGIAGCDTHTACRRKNTDSGKSLTGCYIFTGEIKAEGFMNMKWKFAILAAAICMILSSCITITPAEPENIGEDTALPENAEEDEVMLKNGSYPPNVKARILSDKGHLSNEACTAELADFIRCGVFRIMLGHISENNNRPALAVNTSVDMLRSVGMKQDLDYTLSDVPAVCSGKSILF